MGVKPEKNTELILPLSFAAVGILAALIGFALGHLSRPDKVETHANPFWIDIKPLSKGKDFGLNKEVRHLSGPDRKLYRESVEEAQIGGDSKALEGFNQLLDVRKACLPAYGQAALLHMRAMDSSRADSSLAASLLTVALAQNPDHPWLCYVAGRFWEKSGRSDSARSYFQKAVSLSPRFAYPYIGLGRLELAAGETGPAEKNFKTAVALMEAAPKVYREDGKAGVPVTEAAPFDYLATVYYEAGADDSARMALDYGREKGWQTDRMDLVQGWLWESQGFLPRADSLYHDLMAKDPRNPEYAQASRTLGWKPARSGAGSGARPGSPAEATYAISLLDPMARKYPGNVPVRLALGKAYMHRGLYGLAVEHFDSCLAHDPAIPGLREIRDLAYETWLKENHKPGSEADTGLAGAGSLKPNAIDVLSNEKEEPVIVPGSIALLGTYTVPWGCTPGVVLREYPKKAFRLLPNGDLLDVFVQDGVRHEYLLAFRDGKLWGIRVLVTDTANVAGDLFGRLIRVKSKIAGEGKGTGETSCPGYLAFQGVIWENNDTFEFMAQFMGKENQVRMARLGQAYMPQNRRLCELVSLLKAETWQ